jgi:hypothetical protein
MGRIIEANNKPELIIIIRVINYLYLMIVIVGTVANVLAFVVFSRKAFKNTIFSTYFRALLVVDTIGLLFLTLGKFLSLEFGIDLRDLHLILCKITMPLAYSIPTISAHITVMIKFDRWLSIAKPTVLLIRKKRKFQLIVCITIILINFAYNGQLFFSYIDFDPANKNDWEKCTIINQNLLSTMDLINSTLLPFILMLLFSLLTINAVFVSRNRIRNAILSQRNASSNRELFSSIDLSRKRDIRFVFASILSNIIFLIFNAPHTTFFFVTNNMMNQSTTATLNFQLTLLLSYLNHAIVFFINLAVNSQFKEELSNLYLEIKQKFSRS